MAEAGSAGQQDKKAAEQKTEQVGAEKVRNEARSAAEVTEKLDPSETTTNPYPNYDFMQLEDLRELAKSRGVEINRDVERAHLITELRAADSGVLSPTNRLGAR